MNGHGGDKVNGHAKMNGHGGDKVNGHSENIGYGDDVDVDGQAAKVNRHAAKVKAHAAKVNGHTAKVNVAYHAGSDVAPDESIKGYMDLESPKMPKKVALKI